MNITHNRLHILLEIQSCTQAVINTHTLHSLNVSYSSYSSSGSRRRRGRKKKRHDYVHRSSLAQWHSLTSGNEEWKRNICKVAIRMYDQPCHGRSEIHITWIISEHNRPRNQIFTTWKIRDIQRRSFFFWSLSSYSSSLVHMASVNLRIYMRYFTSLQCLFTSRRHYLLNMCPFKSCTHSMNEEKK